MRDALANYANVLDWLADEITTAERDGQLLERLDGVFSPKDAQKLLAVAPNAGQLVRLASEGKPLLLGAADLALLRPEECDRSFNEQFKRKLNENPVTAFFALDYPGERREEAVALVRPEMLKTAIDILDRGEAALKSHPDPFGQGPFEYVAFDGGFKLYSQLVHHIRIHLIVGLPTNK
jgi:hypothetical protein